VLFGDRVTQRDLAIAGTPVSFDEDAGFEELLKAVTEADITILES
jgi:hypothetical protein